MIYSPSLGIWCPPSRGLYPELAYAAPAARRRALAPAAVAASGPPVAGYLQLFDPSQQVYSDAGVTPVVTAGTVQQWNDLGSAAKNLSQSSATKRPVYLVNQINSLSAVIFDGVDDFLQTATFTTAQPVEVYIVCKLTTSALSGTHYDAVTNGSFRCLAFSPEIALQAGLIFDSGSPTIGTSYNYFNMQFNGASSKVSVGAGSDSTGNCGSNSRDGLTLGALGGGGQPMTLNVAYMLIYASILSAGDRTTTKNFLKTTFNL